MVASRYLIIKRGEQGMSIFEKGAAPSHIPTTAREVFDVTGAGDTVIAAAAAALLAGASIGEAAILANAAAGVVVGKIGTAVCSPEELLKASSGESRRNNPPGSAPLEKGGIHRNPPHFPLVRGEQCQSASTLLFLAKVG